MARHTAPRLILAVALALPLTACSPSEEDLCDAACECEYCTAHDWDLCMHYYESWSREADYWDCEDYYDDWLDCRDATGHCYRGGWSTSCSNEMARLDACTGGPHY